MKIIHCADLHLDSALTSHLDPETARKRRGELLHNFERIVEFAASEGAAAILIAGDLFDTSCAGELARSTLLQCVSAHPGIAFFYLRGNHDEKFCLDLLRTSGNAPVNLMFFGREWNCYECGGVAIYGAELSQAGADFYDGLNPDKDQINLVMLHGTLSDSPDGVDYGIDVRRLRGKHIDYLALGHIHSHGEGMLDDRGDYCYPGCPEGRGFDECEGEHGIVLLDIDEKSRSVSHRFIPFERRRCFAVTADLTGCMTTREMIMRAAEALAEAGCSETSLVKLTLTGELDAECEKDLVYLRTAFDGRYFFLRIVDETRLKLDWEGYQLDESLKGEFIRTVLLDDTLSDEDKAAVARYGIRALAGEEAD